VPTRQLIPLAMLSNPWFAGLPESIQWALVDGGDRLSIRAGEMLYRQGDAPSGFIGVASGTFKVSTLREDGKEGILAVMEAGNWFGEISLFDGMARPHDVTALEAAEVIVVGFTAFERLLESPAFARAMSLLLARRVRLLYGLVEDAMLRSMRTRVARRLLALAHGDATLSSDTRLEVPVSQEALAMMLGITRQTLSKELKTLARDGVLRLAYGRIEIASAQALKAIAAWR
jgi:CRP/FNR family cyclic AMP-dependent transcriptional regulator